MLKQIGHRKHYWYLPALAAAIALMLIAQIPLSSTTSADIDATAANASTLQTAPPNPGFDNCTGSATYGEAFGYVPPPLELNVVSLTTTLHANALGEAALPSSFDWRDSGNVTSIKDQSSCGTCWAFGTTTVLESGVLINESASFDFSEQSVVVCTDPSCVYLAEDRCGGGGWGWMAAETFIKKGARLESCQPYNTNTINSESCNGSCDTIKVVTGYRVVSDDGNDITRIKDAIYNHGPTTIAFCWNSSHNYSGNIFYWPDCTDEPNHMVSIVGWNDSIPHPAGGGAGAWIVKNSWGTDWGNDGYFYLCYGSANEMEIAYFLYKDYDPLEKLYYWDEAGMLSSLGTGSTDSAWMASLFTSTQNGNITNIDFWVPSSNAQYQIYIYNGKFGTLLTSQTGGCSEPGYYSISLDTPVYRNVGQQFTIAVRMTTPGYNYPIAIELKLSGSWNPPIQTGVSFYRSADSGSFYDLWRSRYNACLRARILDDGTTPILPPSTPALTAPASRAAGLNLTPTLQWSAASGADTYNLQISTTSAFSAIVLNQTGITNTAFDIAPDTINWNTRYYWRVNARNGGGVSAWSTSRYFNTAYGPPPDAPSDLTAAAVSSSQINLAWTDNSDNETGFRIERKTGVNGSYRQIASVGANVTSYSNTRLSANTTYYYRVRAYNTGGNSGYSDEAYNTTLPPPPPRPTLVSPASRATVNTTPTLAWNPSSGAVSYNVQISTSSSFATTVVSATGIGATAYTVDPALNPATRYYWRVAAVGTSGSTSAWSSYRYFTTAAP